MMFLSVLCKSAQRHEQCMETFAMEAVDKVFARHGMSGFADVIAQRDEVNDLRVTQMIREVEQAAKAQENLAAYYDMVSTGDIDSGAELMHNFILSLAAVTEPEQWNECIAAARERQERGQVTRQEVAHA